MNKNVDSYCSPHHPHDTYLLIEKVIVFNVSRELSLAQNRDVTIFAQATRIATAMSGT
ncbi:hypothetical protein NIES2135_68080 (plasmid) [Leptolyngbya boryana NIES-2135]|uniref:Uncharacterized protein n=1 Tax=Leptolyngbya boryana NIES-2135 TaxID=1973484 RepID=A0A1Z4JT62_LEPBY|nr:hypothetical protein NIES2135_68080 [Leptolyngbya boryana NIES-2135]